MGSIDLRLADAFDPSKLELILLSTEKCNFRCTYCYEDFLIGKMSRTVIDGVKALIEKRTQDLRQLTFEWFGGEPLVAPDVVFELSEFAHELCSRRGVAFWGGLTTNGSKITPEVLERLVNCGMGSFQISLDGDQPAHDTTRIQANGRGTFDLIWRNLIAASQTSLDFRIKLRLHVTTSNTDSVRDLVYKLHEAFGRDHRFSLFFHKVSNLGNAKDKSFISKEEYASRLQGLQALADDLWRPEARPELVALPGATPGEARSELDLLQSGYVCYAAKPNSLLVRADGRLGKCTVAFSDVRNTIGRINADGTLDLDRDKLNVWMKGFETMDNATLACPYSKMGWS